MKMEKNIVNVGLIIGVFHWTMMIRFYDYNDNLYDECFSVKLSLLKKLPRRHTALFQRRYDVVRRRIDV